MMRLDSNFSCPVILSVLALALTGCASRMEAMLSTRYTIKPEPVEPWEDGEIPVAADRVEEVDVYVLLRNIGTKPIRIEWVSFSKRGIQPLGDRSPVIPELEPGEVIAYKSKTDPCWLPPQIFVKFGKVAVKPIKGIAIRGFAQPLPDATFDCNGKYQSPWP